MVSRRHHRNRRTKEEVEEAIKNAESISEVGRRLGFESSGSMYIRVKALALEYGLELPSWDYKLSSERVTKWNTTPDDEYFVQGVYHSGRELRIRLLRLGWSYSCTMSDCLLFGVADPVWSSKPLVLHVDHVNGDKFDNRLDNLRFLCPNCHQQTDTWGNKKRNTNGVWGRG